MSISKKLRFEVFKRDNFTCQYCGRKTPETVLEVDHIISVSEGGQDDLTNLVTSCFECNRGKGKISLERVPAQEEDLHEKTILLLERERQLREYNEVLNQIRERENTDLKDLTAHWEQYFNPCYFRWASIRTFLKLFTRERIKDAIEITSEKDGLDTTNCYKGESAFRYLCGILNKWRQNAT